MEKGLDIRAVKFQRLVFGVLLLFAFAFQIIPIIVFVAILMFGFCLLPVSWAPLYRLSFVWMSKEPQQCSCAIREVKFACGLGFSILGLALLFKLLGYENITWTLVVFIGFFSLLAATSGFCLGSLIYELGRKLFNR